MNGNCAKALARRDIVTRIRPFRVEENVVIVLDQQLKRVDPPRIIVADLREAESSALRDTLVVTMVRSSASSSPRRPSG